MYKNQSGVLLCIGFGWNITINGNKASDIKAAYSVTMNIFRKKNIFFLNHLQK